MPEVSQCSEEIRNATAEQSAGTQQIEQARSRLGELTHEISAATEQQSSGTEKVVDSIEKIRVMVQQNAESSSELASSSEELSRQSGLMRELTSRFQVEQNGNGARPARANGGSTKPSEDELATALDSVENLTGASR